MAKKELLDDLKTEADAAEAPAADSRASEAPADGDWRQVVVHHANMSEENRDLPIIVNAVGTPAGRRKITPGKPVSLHVSHIEILNNAVEEHTLIIPEGSGIYEARDPISAAEQQYPGYAARWDRANGVIVMHKRVRNYIVSPAQ